MPTTRPLRTAWKSLWKKSRSGRARSNHPLMAESLETRILPAAVNVTATADGYARDANRDNVFTVLDTSGNNLLVRSTTGTNVGYERSMLEFDLTNISTALSVNSATLVLNVSQFTRYGVEFPQINIVGYTGNGVIELTDASVAGPVIGNTTITARGELRIDLDTDYIRSQGGNFLGLRIENPVLNGPFGIFTALDSPLADPVLELDLTLDVDDFEFNIDEQRPNGTIVGDAGIGNNATYQIISGDPTNVFAIGSNTGLITVADSSQLQHSLQPQYVLTVQAQLLNGSVGEYTVTINVKNVFGSNKPPVVTESQFSVEEFAPVGTFVGKVIAVDPDAADPLQYSIVSGNANNAFKINSVTGEITVNSQTALSLRNQTSFVLRVAVRDTRIPRNTVYQRIPVFLTPRATAVPDKNRVQLIPVVDAEVRDLNNDGVFESINQTADVLRIENDLIERRAVMEFDLSGISSGKVVKSAFLTVYVKSAAGGQIPISVYGYAGNGAISSQDAVSGTLLHTETLTFNNAFDFKTYTIELTPAFLQQFIGTSTELGIVLRNDSNSLAINLDSSESAELHGDALARRPTLNLLLDDVADDVVFNNTINQGLTVARSTGSAFTTFAASALRQGVEFSELLTGDFNGDGRLDIAGRNAANGQILVALAAANQFVTGASWTTFSTVTTFSDLVVGDFNGDGRDDIAGRSAQGQLLVALSTGTKFNNVVFDTLPTNQRSLSNVNVGDFNGDGRDDLMGIVTSTGEVVVSISNGSSFSSSVWGSVPVGSTSEVNVGDFTGDGRDDIFTRQGVADLVVLRSTGTAFVNTLFGTLAPGVPYIGFRMGDFNGDGLEDVVGFLGNGGTTIYKSTGLALVGGGLLGARPDQVDPSDIVIGDFNRDGKSDILVRSTETTMVGNVATTTQKLFVSLGTGPHGGPFVTSLWGTIENEGPFTLLGVGNY